MTTIKELYKLASLVSKNDWDYLCTKKEFMNALDNKSYNECQALITKLLNVEPIPEEQESIAW